MKIDPWHGITEIKYGSKAYFDEPFILAQQAAQVYYTPFPSKKKEMKDWWVICVDQLGNPRGGVNWVFQHF